MATHALGCTAEDGVTMRYCLLLAALAALVCLPARAAEAPDLASRIERAIELNAARERAISSISGFVAYDYRESRFHCDLERRSSQRMYEQRGGTPEWFARADAPVTICAGEFVAAQDRFKLDGVMLNDGGEGTPWGFAGWATLPPAALKEEGAAARFRRGRGTGLMPRTVIVRDGGRETHYSEAAGSQVMCPESSFYAETAAGQAKRPESDRRRPVCQTPIGPALFCSIGTSSFSELLAATWQHHKESLASPLGTRFSLECLGEVEAYGTRCLVFRYSWHSAVGKGAVIPPPPAGSDTIWLGVGFRMAPVRVMRFMLSPFPGSSQVHARLWVAEDYQQVSEAVWLPTKSRVERAQASPGEPVEWLTIEQIAASELSVNRALTPLDFAFTGPPIGTCLLDRAGGPPATTVRGQAAFELAAAWVRDPPVLAPDVEFTQALREYADHGWQADRPER